MDKTRTDLQTMSPEALAMLGAPTMVYIREVDADELIAAGILPPGFQHPEGHKLYAVHAANGDRMAVLDDREMAFDAARQHKMVPVSVH